MEGGEGQYFRNGTLLENGRAKSIVFTVTCVKNDTKAENKAGYTAQDAPSTRFEITRDGRTDLRTDLRTDGRTDTTSYRDATAHLKIGQ